MVRVDGETVRAVSGCRGGSTSATITTSASAIGLGGADDFRLLNLWTGATSTTSGAISAVVAPHGVVMYRVSMGARLS